RPPVEVRLDGRARGERLVRPPGHRLRGLQPLPVDVVQADRRGRELREREDVSEQVARELDAAGTDECDACHARKCFRSDRNEQECSRSRNSGRSTSCPPPPADSPFSPPTSARSSSPRSRPPAAPPRSPTCRR